MFNRSNRSSAHQSRPRSQRSGSWDSHGHRHRRGNAKPGNIRQNLFFAFLYNALGIPVAAGVLYPFFDLLLSPIIAGSAMSLSLVSVISNALRLRKVSL